MGIKTVGNNVLMLNQESLLEIINDHFKYNFDQKAVSVVQMGEDDGMFAYLFKVDISDPQDKDNE